MKALSNEWVSEIVTLSFKQQLEQVVKTSRETLVQRTRHFITLSLLFSLEFLSMNSRDKFAENAISKNINYPIYQELFVEAGSYSMPARTQNHGSNALRHSDNFKMEWATDKSLNNIFPSDFSGKLNLNFVISASSVNQQTAIKKIYWWSISTKQGRDRFLFKCCFGSGLLFPIPFLGCPLVISPRLCISES